MFFCTSFVIVLLTSAVVAADPCSNYTVINSTTSRQLSYILPAGTKPTCDTFFPGWYRFNETAKGLIATACPTGDTQCGSERQIWINGSLPSVADGQVNRTICVKDKTNSCSLKKSIRVKNCTTYQVYNLMPTTFPCMRYCLEDDVSVISTNKPSNIPTNKPSNISTSKPSNTLTSTRVFDIKTTIRNGQTETSFSMTLMLFTMGCVLGVGLSGA